MLLPRPPLLCARALRQLVPRPRRSSAMPLRAKIMNNSFSQSAIRRNDYREGFADEPDDVLFAQSFGIRTIELNRPAKLNSLNASMVRKITPRLQEWEKSQLANIIILKGAGERALCAGGDVKTLALANQTGPEGQAESAKFFAEEYRLDHLVATYSKPYVAFMDGITMGGGVGLSVHAPFRIATERTHFAMPETKIGFFPDVGGSFFLPRLDGEIGTYLALTSAPLMDVQNLYAGIATHYIHSSSLPDVETRLAELVFPDYATPPERNAIVNATIEEFMTGLPERTPFILSGPTREAIDRCFRYDSIDDIIRSLEAEPEETSEWAKTTLATLNERSPASLRVALRAQRAGRNWAIADTFQREHHLAKRFMAHHDFTEGVLSLLGSKEEKRTPQWQPATLEEMTKELEDDFFLLREGEEMRMELLKRDVVNYRTYPYAGIGLPSEREILQVVESGRFLRRDAVQVLLDRYGGKKGVNYKVNEVLDRKTTTDEVGLLLLK